MDSYFSNGVEASGFRRETLRMDDLADDTTAIAEGERIQGWKRPVFYEIRAIMTSARSRDRLVYSSRTVHDGIIESQVVPEGAEHLS
jgi:hypothetical protein